MTTDQNISIAKQLRQMEEELTRLFEEESYEIQRKPCRGKYRGHTDYTIVFGSGRRLYIGLDKRNYATGLQSHLQQIRLFRANQEENRQKIKAAIFAATDRFSDVTVEIRPMDHETYLIVYAVVVLTLPDKQELVYRTTNMHYCLVGTREDWCSYDRCIKHLLSSMCGSGTTIGADNGAEK